MCLKLLFWFYQEEHFGNKGALYRPTSKLHEKLISKTQIKPKESESERIRKATADKKRSNLELFKEELKR